MQQNILFSADREKPKTRIKHFPLRMGILGAVLATGFAPIISMGVLSIHWLKKQNHFHWMKHRTSLRLSANIISLGIPSLVAEAASGIVMIVFNSILVTLCGNTGVAAYGIIANLSLVVTSIYTGIAQGTQPIMSRAYGSGDNNKIKQILRYAVGSALFLSAFKTTGIWLSYPATEIVVCLIGIVLAITGKKKVVS